MKRDISQWRNWSSVSPKEYAAIQGIGEGQVYKALKTGAIPFYKISERRILIPISALLNKCANDA